MALKSDRNTRAQTSSDLESNVLRQLQALRRKTGRQKSPRKLVSQERKNASRSRRSKRSNSGKVEKQQNLYQQITNPRNWYHNDTVKTLMRQIAELNDRATSSRQAVKKQSEVNSTTGVKNMFNLELPATRIDEGQIGNVYGTSIKTSKKVHNANKTPKTSSVVELIEKQVLRDITRHLLKKRKREVPLSPKNGETVDSNIHQEESSDGMKIVITKTPKNDSKHLSQMSELNKKFLPSYVQHGLQRSKLRKPVRIRTDRISLPSLHDKPPTLTAPATLSIRPRQTHDSDVSKSKHENSLTLPRIYEETDLLGSGDILAHGQSIITAEKSTNTDDFHSLLFDMMSPPEVTSDSDNKVKLPILGKSIGTERYSFSEIASKRSYYREVRKMIHGLYGEYFEPGVEKNFTYDQQLASYKEQLNKGRSVKYVTPSLEENDTKAGSYTLQLYHSSQNKHDDSHTATKANKMSIPVLRNKYGQTIALSKKRNGKREVESQTHIDAVKCNDNLFSFNMMGLNNDKNVEKVIQEEYYPRMTPNTPDSDALDLQRLSLHDKLTQQVSLYKDQVAREHAYLNGLQSGIDQFSTRPYYAFYPNPHPRLPDQLAYDGVDIDLYLEIKHRKSLERRLRLQELKEKHKARNESKKSNYSHLEVVEQRDKFLSSIKPLAENPKTSESVRTQENNMSFDYYHGNHIAETPVTKLRSKEHAKYAPQRHGMDTKIYRIFAERKRDKKSSTQPKQDTEPVTEKQKTNPSNKVPSKNIIPVRYTLVDPPISDLVSRFQVATRYKLDRDYVKSLATTTNN